MQRLINVIDECIKNKCWILWALLSLLQGRVLDTNLVLNAIEILINCKDISVHILLWWAPQDVDEICLCDQFVGIEEEESESEDESAEDDDDDNDENKASDEEEKNDDESSDDEDDDESDEDDEDDESDEDDDDSGSCLIHKISLRVLFQNNTNQKMNW